LQSTPIELRRNSTTEDKRMDFSGHLHLHLSDEQDGHRMDFQALILHLHHLPMNVEHQNNLLIDQIQQIELHY